MNKRDSLIFINHISNSIGLIENFILNVSEEDFKNNEEKQSAVIRQIEIIGEAVKNIPESFREKYHNILWSEIARARDKFIHHYFGIDLDIVWDIVKKDLPKLKKKIKLILKNEK